jgi:hypothetical protein
MLLVNIFSIFIGETLGYYGKRLYLCTRFREARPFGFVRIGSVTIERVH